MKVLTATDASLLAIVAEKPNLPKEQKRRLLARLSKGARSIAEAMNGAELESSPARRSAAARIATGVRKWSLSNKGAATARIQRRIK